VSIASAGLTAVEPRDAGPLAILATVNALLARPLCATAIVNQKAAPGRVGFDANRAAASFDDSLTDG
jgi:hypothetical protein